MKILITCGPTREAIDLVRYIGNRSSGRMGAALAQAAVDAGHSTTVVAGPIQVCLPTAARRIDVESAAEMHAAVMREFASHDLLIMAAAVADFRPKQVSSVKLSRKEGLTIELEATPDIVAHASRIKQANQRTIGFSLEKKGNVERAREKLKSKRLDLIVFNSTETINSDQIEPVLLWADGKMRQLPPQSKADFAIELLSESQHLFHN